MYTLCIVASRWILIYVKILHLLHSMQNAHATILLARANL
jgi:hypothetical protein